MRRLVQHVRSAVLERVFEFFDHQAVAVEIQALKRIGRSRDVAAKALELPALMRLAGDASVQ